MRASILISRLNHLIRCHGDQEVLLDLGNQVGLREIAEVDVDAEDTGIIVWPQGGA